MGLEELVAVRLKVEGFQRFTNQMRKIGIAIDRNVKRRFNETAVAGKRIAMRLEQGAKEAMRFRMELLGVMFFGMAVSRMFSNMLRPAAELFGIFELWGIMLQITFLPIMELLFPQFMKLFDVFIGLPKEIQLVMGAFALFGVVLGLALFAIGQFGLGFHSLQIAFMKFVPWLRTFKIGFFSTFGIILAVVLAFVVGFVMAWKTNFGRVREWTQVIWEGIKNIIGGVINVIKGWWMVLTGFLRGDMSRVSEGFEKLWNGLKQFILGINQFIIGILVTLGLSITKLLGDIVKWIIDGLFGEGTFDKVLQWGKDFIKKMADGIKAGVQWVKDAIIWVFEQIGLGGIGETIGSFFGGGKRQNDFLMRPGQAPVSFSPNDTIVGTKGGLPSGSPIINQTLNINVSNAEEIERMIDENNARLVDDLRRMSPTG